MIDANKILLIKDRMRIEDVVGAFFDLKKSGIEYTCLCPFHEDRHFGSFKVSPKKNIAKCFSCGWHGDSVKFLMDYLNIDYPDAIRWLGQKYSIDVDMEDTHFTPPPPRPLPPPLPMLTLPMQWVQRRHRGIECNTLVNWLRTGIRWDAAQRARIDQVFDEYCLGHNQRTGMTIFWQIDEQQQVRTGKMMLYKSDGHRDREARYGFDWIHSALYRDRRHPDYDAEKVEARPTLFGMHLLNKYPNAEVHIVESEKTAILMAIAYGNNVKELWMACGGLEMLSAERLKPIIDQGRRIVLYPDRDGVAKWKAKAENLHYSRVAVNTEPVLRWWLPEDGEKADIADVVVRMINSHPIPMTVTNYISKDDP